MSKAKRLSLVFCAPLACALIACSPQAYQVNPNPNVASTSGSVPESQQEGYMRIIGDLRWDKFRSLNDWRVKFPRCHHNKSYFGNDISFGAPNEMFKFGDPQIDAVNTGKEDCGFELGGIQFIIRAVSIDSNKISGRESTKEVDIVIPDPASRRAFQASIRNKYELATESDSPKYCSKYSCFEFHDGMIYDSITPTPYTISILDAIKVDSTQF